MEAETEQKTASDPRVRIEGVVSLLPCPFCGSPDVELSREDASIYCNNCPGQATNFLIPIAELVAAWNMRANA